MPKVKARKRIGFHEVFDTPAIHICPATNPPMIVKTGRTRKKCWNCGNKLRLAASLGVKAAKE